MHSLSILYHPEQSPVFKHYITESLNSGKSLFILCDSNTYLHCFPKLTAIFPDLLSAKLITIPAGEEHKNIQTCALIWEKLMYAHADRNSVLINLGGGVITDMGGLAASLFKRGIDFCNIPTTLLSMIDGAIGGKTAIDFLHYKNQIGTFTEAVHTLVNPDFLQTLSQRQLWAGWAELIKIALVVDARLWYDLRGVGEDVFVDMLPFIRRAIELKIEIVNEDPFDKGRRNLLNFGHSIGHALESLTLLDKSFKLLHGEAVALGMISELWLSTEICGLDKSFRDEAVQLIATYFGHLKFNFDQDEFLKIIHHDKKNAANKVKMVLVTSPGEAEINVDVTDEMVLKSLSFLQEILK